MKICKLIRRHSFLDVRVFQKEARSLAALGHDVCLMAPRYNGSLLNVNKAPLRDKRYGGQSFVMDHVTIIPYEAKRIASIYHKANVEKAMLRSLLDGTLAYQLDGLLLKARDTGADVFHAHEPETLYEAVQAKRFQRAQGKNVKVVYDAHELENDTPLLRELMKETDRLITVSDSIASIYAKRYPQATVTIIYNSPKLLEHAEEPEPPIAYSKERPMIIGYEGMVTKEKGDPNRMIGMLDSLSQAGLHVRLRIFGQVHHPAPAERVKIEKRFKSDPRVDYEWVDYEELGDQWKNVDAGYIYFDLSSKNRVYALPNKFFSMLGSGVPVVVNDAAAMGAVIREHACGLVAQKKNASASDFAQQFAKLYSDRELLASMERNARAAMRDVYCWEKMEQRLAMMYQELEHER